MTKSLEELRSDVKELIETSTTQQVMDIIMDLFLSKKGADYLDEHPNDEMIKAMADVANCTVEEMQEDIKTRGQDCAALMMVILKELEGDPE